MDTSELKYVVIENQFGSETPIVFPNTLYHDEVAGHFRNAHFDRIVSAGFCYLTPEVFVWGKSQSLGKESRHEDAELIRKLFKL